MQPEGLDCTQVLGSLSAAEVPWNVQAGWNQASRKTQRCMYDCQQFHMPWETKGSFPVLIWASVRCCISSCFSSQQIYTNEDLFYEIQGELNPQVRGPYSQFSRWAWKSIKKMGRIMRCCCQNLDLVLNSIYANSRIQTCSKRPMLEKDLQVDEVRQESLFCSGLSGCLLCRSPSPAAIFPACSVCSQLWSFFSSPGPHTVHYSMQLSTPQKRQ